MSYDPIHYRTSQGEANRLAKATRRGHVTDNDPVD